MTISKISKHEVTTLSIDKTVLDVAKIMKEKGIGDVIIVNDKNQPIGIVTDRDIIIKIVADEVSQSQTLVSDIMNSDLLLLKDYQPYTRSV